MSSIIYAIILFILIGVGVGAFLFFRKLDVLLTPSTKLIQPGSLVPIDPLTPSTPLTFPTHPSTPLAFPTHPLTPLSYPTHPSTPLSYPTHPSTPLSYPTHPSTPLSYPTHPSTPLSPPKKHSIPLLEYIFLKDTYTKGGVIAGYNGTSTDCLQKCSTMSDCKGVMAYPVNNMCWLKNEKAGPHQSIQGWNSYIKK